MTHTIIMDSDHYYRNAIKSLLKRGEITVAQANKCLKTLNLKSKKRKYHIIMKELDIPFIKWTFFRNKKASAKNKKN